MKGLHKLMLAASLQSLSFVNFAGNMGPMDDALANVFIPALKPGFKLSASVLILQPEADNLGWSATTTVLPIPTPQWEINAFNPEIATGFHLGAQYIFSYPGTDLQLNWFYLNAKDYDTVQVNPATQWVSPFSQTGTPPTGGEITGVASLKRAEASLNFNYNAVNLDIGKFINFGDDLQTRLFMGISSAFITEKLYSTFYGEPRVIFSLNKESTYQGGGPRLGFNNEYNFYRGIHLIGQIAGSLLMGRLTPAEYKFEGTSSELALVGITLNQEKLGSSSVTKIVPAIDVKLGLNYSYLLQQNRELGLELGYMGALYFNAFSSYETNTNVIALDSGSLSTSSVKHVPSNFSVGGLYVTVSYRC